MDNIHDLVVCLLVNPKYTKREQMRTSICYKQALQKCTRMIFPTLKYETVIKSSFYFKFLNWNWFGLQNNFCFSYFDYYVFVVIFLLFWIINDDDMPSRPYESRINKSFIFITFIRWIVNTHNFFPILLTLLDNLSPFSTRYFVN